MSGSLWGLDPTFAPAAFGLFGSLIGAGAALGGQLISQIMIGYRESRQRTLRAQLAREIFAARVRLLAQICDVVLDPDDSSPDTIPDLPLNTSVKNTARALTILKDGFEPLLRDYENTAFVLSLDDPTTVTTLGRYLPKIALLIRSGNVALDRNQERARTSNRVGLDAIAADEIGSMYKLILQSANSMLKALGKEPEKLENTWP